MQRQKNANDAEIVKRFLESSIRNKLTLTDIANTNSEVKNSTTEKPITQNDSPAFSNKQSAEVDSFKETSSFLNDQLKCLKKDHSNCGWRCNVKQSERYKRYYHSQVKDNKIICERCGISVLTVYIKKHYETEKCQNTMKLNEQIAKAEQQRASRSSEYIKRTSSQNNQTLPQT
jgi:hypothetical protein